MSMLHLPLNLCTLCYIGKGQCYFPLILRDKGTHSGKSFRSV